MSISQLSTCSVRRAPPMATMATHTPSYTACATGRTRTPPAHMHALDQLTHQAGLNWTYQNTTSPHARTGPANSPSRPQLDVPEHHQPTCTHWTSWLAGQTVHSTDHFQKQQQNSCKTSQLLYQSTFNQYRSSSISTAWGIASHMTTEWPGYLVWPEAKWDHKVPASHLNMISRHLCKWRSNKGIGQTSIVYNSSVIETSNGWDVQYAHTHTHTYTHTHTQH